MALASVVAVPRPSAARVAPGPSSPAPGPHAPHGMASGQGTSPRVAYPPQPVGNLGTGALHRAGRNFLCTVGAHMPGRRRGGSDRFSDSGPDRTTVGQGWRDAERTGSGADRRADGCATTDGAHPQGASHRKRSGPAPIVRRSPPRQITPPAGSRRWFRQHGSPSPERGAFTLSKVRWWDQDRRTSLAGSVPPGPRALVQAPGRVDLTPPRPPMASWSMGRPASQVGAAARAAAAEASARRQAATVAFAEVRVRITPDRIVNEYALRSAT